MIVTMETYPIMLNMKGKAVAVIGGGRIASRKMVGLLHAGANVTVVSPEINSNIEKLVNKKQINWKKKLFEPGDLDSVWLVIAATNNKKINEFVASSSENHQLVNVVSNDEIGDFHVPATLTRGQLTISVATGGASPILAKVIRDELAVIYDDTYEDYLSFLAMSRKKMKQVTCSQKAKTHLLNMITDDTYRKSKSKQKDFLEMMEGLADG